MTHTPNKHTYVTYTHIHIHTPKHTHACTHKQVDGVDSIKYLIQRIREKIDRLHEAHKSRLLVSFGGTEGDQDREIDSLTRQITGHFREVEGKLRAVGVVGGM